MIDEILYDGGSNSAWPSPTGASFAFNQIYSSSAANSATENDNFNFWCVSANPYGDGSQLGTPGEVNDNVADISVMMSIGWIPMINILDTVQNNEDP